MRRRNFDTEDEKDAEGISSKRKRETSKKRAVARRVQNLVGSKGRASLGFLRGYWSACVFLR